MMVSIEPFPKMPPRTASEEAVQLLLPRERLVDRRVAAAAARTYVCEIIDDDDDQCNHKGGASIHQKQ
jgi:hypothetical protein